MCLSFVIEANDEDGRGPWRWDKRKRMKDAYLPSHPPRAQTLSESWIATDAFPGCFVRAIVQDASASVGAFYAPRSLDVLETSYA